MATHNRKRQLQNSLRAIEFYSKKYDVEIIIVDDNSDEKFTQEELSEFNLDIRYRIRTNRYRQDPVIPNNMAFNLATGDIILMSCGEILLLDNIVKYALENTTDFNYLCYSVYAFNWDQLNFINEFRWKPPQIKKIKDIYNELSKTNTVAGDSPGWYIHSKYRPVALPFCASLTRANMEKLSGYDERFIFGVGHADDDFLRRIHTLGLEVRIIDNVVAIHQPHSLTDYSNPDLVRLNCNLYVEQEKSGNIKAENNIVYKR